MVHRLAIDHQDAFVAVDDFGQELLAMMVLAPLSVRPSMTALGSSILPIRKMPRPPIPSSG